MSPVTLEEDTLGEKHRHFNKLVDDAIADENYELRNICSSDSDIDNLLKIAIASRNRNVNYIIEVMKSNDMLYAATAIKKSTWLVTEPQYANIINPEYLHTQLLPNMNTKTFNKLMLQIRLNLKDESRVEAFYEFLKEKYSSYKWLQNCSIPFIENVIKQERPIPLCLFKRLCKRSGRCLKLYTRVEEAKLPDAKYEIFCYLKSHTVDVLKVLEDFDYFPGMGKKKTKLLMKYCPLKIINHFDRYGRCEQVDVSVVAQYLKKTELKDFLFKQVKHHQDYNTLRPFIKNMPEEERFEFVRKTFIDKTELSQFCTEEDKNMIESCIKPYQWYEFAPFKVAKLELRKLIRAEISPSERFAMLFFLITCARNPQDIKTMLKYFKDKHINEPFKFKIQFVNNLLSQVSTHEFDVETWNVLDQLFHSMEVYTESDNHVQMCIQSIVLYNVLHDKSVPEIIEQKFSFNTFKDKRRNLNQGQIDKIFAYLLNYLLTKIQSNNISNESDCDETLHNLENVLTLLCDWGKDISKYPSVLQKIQELIKIRQEKMWKTDMSCLYNVKKSWRKQMLEESLSLCLSEEACLNALKHKPQLLTRHDKQIDTLRTDDAVSVRRLLAKLRVYWPHSLAQHFTDAYLLHLNKPTGQKAVVRGLFVLLSQNQVIDMAKKYIPVDYNINWGGTDQADNNIRIRKNIAQNLHVTRPLIPLDTILWYAKGDYLQYVVPSLISVLSKLSETESSRNDSVRKLRHRLGFSKLKPAERKSLILNIWNSTTNTIIRAVIFRNTYDQMCKVKNLSVEKELWKLLCMFFDQLPPRDNRDIMDCISTSLEKVPISVRTEFYVKSYEFLTSLPDSVMSANDRVSNLVRMARWTPDLVESLDDDFVINKLLSPAETKFHDLEYMDIFPCFVLWGKTEEDQLQRFRKLVRPVMEQAFMSWSKGDEDYYTEIDNVKQFIKYLIEKYEEFTLNRKTTPVKLFTEIKTEMEKKMQLLENYALYTSWKLVTEYAILMEQHISKMGNAWFTYKKEKIWKEIHAAMFPELGSIIVNCLKEDTEKYFKSICLLFVDAFDDFSHIYHVEYDFTLKILKNMLNDHDFAPSYIVVSRVTADVFEYIVTDPLKRILAEILNKIKSHPSQEVQIHYRNDFKSFVIDE